MSKKSIKQLGEDFATDKQSEEASPFYIASESYQEGYKKGYATGIKSKKFTKKDLENAFQAGRARRFDTGVNLHLSFNSWFKRNNSKSD